MFRKIDVNLIIRDHIKTLVDYATGKLMPADIFLFFILPLIIAVLIIWVLKFPVNESSANALITSLSVFSALLFNLLLLIYDIIRKEDEKTCRRSRRQAVMREFLRQIYSNISFCIFVAVLCVIILLFAYFDTQSALYYQILSLLVYYLVGVFLLTLLMVLRRVHVLLKKEIEAPGGGAG